MAEATLFVLAQNLIQTLDSEALQALALIWGFRFELRRLQATTNAIKNVILDAEDRQAEEPWVKDWLKRLKAVLYTADDLFDEYATLASRKTITRRNKRSKEVRLFFSRYNQINFTIKVFREIKKIRNELDDIENDGGRFTFIRRELDNGPPVIRRIRDDDHSYIGEDEVISREDDKEAIMRLLLDPTEVEETVSVVCLVGMGGLGKTALAQLLYNDEKVRNEFDVRLWVCVSEEFDVKVIIQKILKSSPDNLELDQLQSKLREVVSNKKYLLVLDDVWNESREEWLKLRRLLEDCGKGSRILVTTRSKKVADIMTDGIPPYDLEGLSDEKSWSLFEKLAFKRGQEQQNPTLVEIGKEIVQKCTKVPLAIQALASYLYDREEAEWLAVRDKEFGGIGDGLVAIEVMEVLKFSYNHLWSPLKQCFAYCSVFPKDSTMGKEELVHLWIAQGFVFPSSSGQSLEDTGHDYFMQLLQRCFFQDVDRDESGNIITCKMHDLIHDLAQRVAEEETMCIESGSRNPDQGVRHLWLSQSPASEESRSRLFSLRSLRTLLFRSEGYQRIKVSDSFFDRLFSSLKRLRVLEIRMIEIQTVSSSVCKLLHLRYLSLVNLPITSLPDSVQELLNLQILRVRECHMLTELPAGVEKLGSLRHLDLSSNLSLVNIAADISKLTCLRHLGLRQCRKLTHVAADISTLTNLTLLDLFGCVSLDHMPLGVENLTSLRHLDLSQCRKLTHVAADISRLTNLTFLDLFGCVSLDHMPSGVEKLTSLRHLDLSQCRKLTLADISRLTNLTFLDLSACLSLDHMPSGLENLTKLRKLRGVFAGTGSSLAAINHLTALEELEIKFREEAYSDQLKTVKWDALNRLRELHLRQVYGLSTLPVGLQHLTTLRALRVSRCPGLIELPEWIHHLSSLEKLEIWECPKLKCLPEEIRRLPHLKELRILRCPLLKGRCAPDGEDWPKIQHIPEKEIRMFY